jgi:hypothetical protein
MRRPLILLSLLGLLLAPSTRADEPAGTPPAAVTALAQATPPSSTSPATQATQPAGVKAGTPTSAAGATDEAKLLSAIREALERNAQEIQGLKERYAKDMEAQRKVIEAQQKQISTLEQSARGLQDQLRSPQEIDRLQKLTEIQQKQMGVLEEQSKLTADQVEKQAPIVEKLQTQSAMQESRSKQAASRDRELADAHDLLTDTVDARSRNSPLLPAPLKEYFLPSGTNVTPFSVWNTLSSIYTLFPNKKMTGNGGSLEFEEYTPFFLLQLNKRFLMSAEVTFTPGGAALGQAQIDAFINDWLTADIGYFLAPTGFLNERLDPRWINKLPDLPLVARQVLPDGLTLTGLQLRGSKYLFRSPVKVEYSAWATNGLGVPGQGQPADWYDLTAVVGTAANVNQAVAWGGRIALWIPSQGINFGVSEFVNSPYVWRAGANMSIWQPYFNYHRGNWDFRFEYGNNYEQTKPFIGHNIHRDGLYAQIAYRNYASLHKHLQRMEYVFRFSDARFRGIDQKGIAADAFDPPMDAPVNRDQYTLGFNYYFYASTILKIAYQFNDEQALDFRDNVFMMQFATNF